MQIRRQTKRRYQVFFDHVLDAAIRQPFGNLVELTAHGALYEFWLRELR
jgi:hypothetical protein